MKRSKRTYKKLANSIISGLSAVSRLIIRFKYVSLLALLLILFVCNLDPNRPERIKEQEPIEVQSKGESPPPKTQPEIVKETPKVGPKIVKEVPKVEPVSKPISKPKAKPRFFGPDSPWPFTTTPNRR